MTNLPPGNLSASDIDNAMSGRTCDGGISITLINFFEVHPDDPNPSPTGIEPLSFRARPIRDSDSGQLTNTTVESWSSDYDSWVWSDEIKSSLSDWFDDFYRYSIGTSLDYFVIDPETRERCFQVSLPTVPRVVYSGNAAPPPPPPLDMNCCDCNTISTILAEQIIAEAKQHEATRELIDRRTIEALRQINKMLQGMQIDLNLQPIIDRLNELEANLWNGLKAGG